MGREFQISYTLPKILFDYMLTISQAEQTTIQRLSRKIIIRYINDYIKELRSK